MMIKVEIKHRPRGIDEGEVVIAIASSSKFYDIAQPMADLLDRAGFVVYTPNFAYNETVRPVSESEKKLLTHSFLQNLQKCSHLYVVAENGYVGKSVCIEVAYAFALGKPIILSEPAEELAIRALTSEVVPRQSVCEYFTQRRRTRDDRIPVAK